jgi:tetratricopeptide (TPR) repeat protein
MTKQLALGTLALAALTMPLAAQNNEAVSKAMFAQAAGKYVAPKCSADKDKHFKVSSGTTYLSSAITTTPDKAPNLLNAGRTVITEAIKDEGQEKSASAWYALGRTYLFQGDVAGADTALRRAEALAPDCKSDIDQMRRIAYTPVANDAAQKMQQGDAPGAMASFRLASALYPSSAFAPYNLAAIYSQEGQPDSAIAYFARAAATKSADSNEVKIAKRAQYNLGVVQLNAGKHQDAVASFEKYVQENPSDSEAKVALAKAYRANGQADKAKALDAETGTTTAAAPSLNSDLDSAVALYKQKKYAESVVIFDRILASEPDNVTALASEANAFLALKNGPRLAKAAGRLSELEPLNRDALMLLREGYRQSKDPEKATATAKRILSQPTAAQITGLTLSGTGAQVQGTATGYDALDAKTGKPLAPAPVIIVFDMVDRGGKVVTSEEVSIPALAKEATHDFSVDAKGEGIVGYRYRVKS